MKFFYKMFLGMTVILAVALGMIEYVTLSYSLAVSYTHLAMAV